MKPGSYRKYLFLLFGTVILAGCGLDDSDQSATDLLTARKGFRTRFNAHGIQPAGPAEPPSPKIFQVVHYTSPVGQLVAYVTPDPRDGQKHPAVVWAHGGFGGIGDHFWEPAPRDDDQSARAFREAGLVLMCPSWRAENDNPGRFELFYGEVDDLLAARDYLAALPYVDPERLYFAGHSTGGTLTLLAAVSTDQFRAAFSFGGAPDLWTVVRDGKGYGNTPFDYRSRDEARMRSALHFVKAIRRPTFYFEGEQSVYNRDAVRMQQAAQRAAVPFQAFEVRGGTHFDILDPLTRLVASKIQRDTGPTCNITLTEKEVKDAFAGKRR